MIVDGIPPYRTDQELPGIPLAWLHSDRKTAIELQTMGAILKAQIVRQKQVIAEQTTFMVADDVAPNWTMTRFDLAVLALIEADLADRGCAEGLYNFVPMYRRTADSADDIFEPPDGFPILFARAPT